MGAVGLGRASRFPGIRLRGWDGLGVGWDDGGMSGSSLATRVLASNVSAKAESARCFAPRRNGDVIMGLGVREEGVERR